ncbi:MAG: LysR family transcriptional regulator substrate-binding protein [Planctomycetota bacterium]
MPVSSTTLGFAPAARSARPMVALERGTVTRDAIDRALRAAGAKPRVVLETGNVEVQKLYASMGFGCAVLPRSAVTDADRRRLAVQPIREDQLQRSIVAVVPRDRYVPRAAQALLEMVAERPAFAPPEAALRRGRPPLR